jgi:sigma-B regulation protein RsbU (phosphoserine phosphatase)
MLYCSTAAEHYATLFFGLYDDSARELVYVNCGHNPPLRLSRDGTLTRLEATATVLGAFDRWEGSAGRARLAPGDLLVLFSDGITEAARDDGEEFGESRLIEELLALGGDSAEAIVFGVLRRVQEFSGSAQSDDLTLLVALAR